MRDHTLDGMSENFFRVFLHQVSKRFPRLSTGVSRIMEILFQDRAFASYLDFVCINHDDKISTINVRRKSRLVLATQQMRYATRNATKDLVIRVHQIPLARNFVLLV